MSVLLPFRIDSIADLPYSIHEALRVGLVFVSWDELESAEIPPKLIWFESDELKKWWKGVERRRKQKYKDAGSGGDDDDIRDEPIDGPWERNPAMDDLVT